MFTAVLVSFMLSGSGTSSQPQRPLSDVARIADVDPAKGSFTVARTTLVIVPFVHDIEVERDGKKVTIREHAGSEQEREVTEGYTTKYWRLTDKSGKEFDWTKARGKVVLFHRDNQLPSKAVLKLLSKDALILYGRD